MKPTPHVVPDVKLEGGEARAQVRGFGGGGACLYRWEKRKKKTLCIAKCKDGAMPTRIDLVLSIVNPVWN